MFFAAFSLLCFYPVATLLSPNFQLQNKALDLKFDQGFLIIDHQAQLFVAGFAVFFEGESWLLVLFPQLCICFALTAANVIIQPCIVPSVNKYKTAALACATVSVICAILFSIIKDLTGE